MTLSEVFYEAACRMSRLPNRGGCYSCELVGEIGGNECRDEYSELMADKYYNLISEEIAVAAFIVGWSLRDYRTFMLLMASEAVK